jgi:hypothetical protein
VLNELTSPGKCANDDTGIEKIFNITKVKFPKENESERRCMAGIFYR